jgi:spore maturation protein SpmA
VGAAWIFSEQPVFAGTPGKANCHGQSVSALAKQYGGLNNAAAALGFDRMSALQNAVGEFCGG